MPLRPEARTPGGEVPSDVYGVIQDLSGDQDLGVFRTFAGGNGPRSFSECFGWNAGRQPFPSAGFRICAVSTPTSSSSWQTVPNGWFDTSRTVPPTPIASGDRAFRVLFDGVKPPVAYLLVQPGPSLSWYGNPSSSQIDASGLIPFGASASDVLAFYPIGAADWPSAVYGIVADSG